MSKFKNNTRINQEHSSLSSCTSSSLSSDEEEIDARDLKPIKDYLSDRKELARQLFKSVKPEKIRMMLPQVLKQMDLSELEEWCVTELSGMSKARILSILNGKTMLESSDTSESDDSGPSLEIISDTEEWLTDDDISTKEYGGKGKLKKEKTKIIGKTQINKKNDTDKFNIKMKCNIKNETIDKTTDVKIKKEDDKDKAKEGDSLLDLLELEMRARAIRALIRKEEDIIPSTNLSQTNNNQTVENNIETPQDVDKAKEDCRKQLERIISAQQNNKGEDEDVVLVIQPTPVVELLSSDSDQEIFGETYVNKKLKNIHTETGKSMSNSDEKIPSKISLQDLKERKGAQEVTGIHNIINNVTKTELGEARIMPERNVGIKNNTLSISISADNVAEKRKKPKKKSHTKSQPTSTSENSRSKQINIETTEQSNDMKNICKEQSTTKLPEENKVTTEEAKKTKEKEIAKESEIEEERTTDLDEIIDLDDYCDVVIGNCDEDKSQDKIIVPSQQEDKQPTSQTTLSKSDSTETWASRYYQTDDVQNVIKESKIQSDIRKRLRERQRLSKLNKSLNLNLSSQSSTTDATVTSETPTGSVEEYLALKRATAANVDTNNSNNNTIQDNLAAINSNNDSNTKEISVQDENISSHQECRDNDVQKAIVLETVDAVSELAVITDTKNDAQPG